MTTQREALDAERSAMTTERVAMGGEGKALAVGLVPVATVLIAEAAMSIDAGRDASIAAGQHRAASRLTWLARHDKKK